MKFTKCLVFFQYLMMMIKYIQADINGIIFWGISAIIFTLIAIYEIY